MSGAEGIIRERFVWPPFSVLDTRRQEWRSRRARWTEAGMTDTATREMVLSPSSPIAGYGDFKTERVAPAQSAFDPVLAELIVRWYAPDGGQVIDPFAGGPVRGAVAGALGRTYLGVDVRPDQIEHNRLRLASLGLEGVHYVTGDSRDMEWPPASADLLFTCPPYYDLEVYSDDPRDLSRAESWSDFEEAYRLILRRATAALRPNRFAVIVVGEVRGPDGDLRSMVALTHSAMRSAGLRLTSDAVLVNSQGTAAMRASRQFTNTRTLVRHHQYVLVYAKGKPQASEWDSPAVGAIPGEQVELFA